MMRCLLFSAAVFLVSLSCGAQSATKTQQDFAAHVQKAQRFLHDKHPEQAIPELRAAAALDPENVEVQGNLGVLLFFQDKSSEAIPYLRKAVEKQPTLSNLQGILGLAEIHTRDSSNGRKDMETAFPHIESTKLKVQVGLELVNLYTASGDLELALPMLAALRKAVPDNAEVLYAAYRTYSDLSSESMFSLAMVAPDSAQWHQLVAHEEIKEGKTNNAIAEFRRALEIDAHLPGARFELAELLYSSKDTTIKRKAEQEYDTAHAENPADDKTLCRLGEIDAERGDFQHSLEKFTRAAELQPDSSDAKLGQAKALMELNQNDKALGILEQSVQAEPANALAHYRLAMLYRKSGRMDEAKREIETFKRVKEAKDKLRAQFKDLLIAPSEIRMDDVDENH